jgi:DNA repair photolyase
MEIEKKIVSPNKKFKSLVYREKAGRRSPWTCNFFIGCSNGCTYCCCSYIPKHNWDTKVKLIKHFENEDHALKIFKEEVIENLDSLRSRGRLFFSLTTDAMLPETKQLTYGAMKICHDLDVPFKVLTKCTQWVNDKFIGEFEINGTVWGEQPKMNLFAFGFSLTGQDEVEIGTDSNLKRINALIKLKKLGFRTFASFEPVIDFDATLSMIMQSHSYIDFMRIGLLNGPTRNKNINLEEMDNFFQSVMNTVKEVPVYWGDSILLGLEKIREELPKNCVVEEIF